MTSETHSHQQNRTRKALMDATIKLIILDGYDKLSITAICHEADYTRRAFYLHFKNVDDIIDVIFTEWFEATHHEVMLAVQHLASPQREYAIWRNWVKVAYKNRELGRQIPLLFRDENQRFWQKVLEMLSEVFSNQEHKFRADVSTEMLIHNEMRFFELIHRKLKSDATLDELNQFVDDNFRLMFRQEPPDIDI